jgi:hypothetical protein
MTRNLGTLFGTAVLDNWDGTPVMTDRGQLVFNFDSQVSVLFSASLVPEPSTILLAAGLVLIGVCRRRAGR